MDSYGPRGQRSRNNYPIRSKRFHSPSHGGTTVMIQNVPTEFSQDELMEEVISVMGLGLFDFFYLPWDAKSNAHAGYVLINFHSHSIAHAALTAFAKYSFKTHPSHQVGRSSLAHTQGLEGNLKLLERRSGLHQSHPCQPVVIWRGRTIELTTIIQVMRGPSGAGCKWEPAPGGMAAPNEQSQQPLSQLLDLALAATHAAQTRAGPASPRVYPVAADGCQPWEASYATTEICVPESQDDALQKYIRKFGALPLSF